MVVGGSEALAPLAPDSLSRMYIIMRVDIINAFALLVLSFNIYVNV